MAREPAYPVPEPLDVAQPSDPFRRVRFRRVGAAVVHLRGHLRREGSKSQGESELAQQAEQKIHLMVPEYVLGHFANLRIA